MILAIAMIAVMFAVSGFVIYEENDAIESDDQTITLVSPLSWGNEKDIPAEITENFVLNDGDEATLDKDFSIAKGAYIIVSDGATLNIDCTKSFSINSLGGGFQFEEGAAISFGILGFGKEMIIDEETVLDINGKMEFKGVLDATNLKASFDLKFYDKLVLTEDDVTYTFKGDSTISIQAIVDANLEDIMPLIINPTEEAIIDFITTKKCNVSASLKVETGEIIATIDQSTEHKIDKSHINTTISLSSPAYLGKDYVQLAITDDTNISMTGAGTNVTIKDSTDLKLQIDALTPDAFLNKYKAVGDFDFTIKATDIDSGDDVKIGDVEFSAKGSFDNKLSCDVKLIIDGFSAPVETEEFTGTVSIDGFKATESLTLDLKSLPEIFTYENISAVVSYYMFEYDSSKNIEYIRDVFISEMNVYFQDPSISLIIIGLIAQAPEEYVVPAGVICGFILDQADEKGIVLEDKYQAIYDSIPGEKKSFSDYITLCDKEIMNIAFDIEDFEMPTYDYNASLDIDGIYYEDVYGKASFENFSADVSVKDDGKFKASASIEFGSAEAEFALIGGDVNTVKIPGGKASMELGDTSMSMDAEIKGDLLIDVGGLVSISGLQIKETAEASLTGSDTTYTFKIGSIEVKSEGIYLNGKGITIKGEQTVAFPEVSAKELLELVIALNELEPPEEMDNPFEVIAFLDEVEDTICEVLGVEKKAITMLEEVDVSIDNLAYTDDNKLSEGIVYAKISDVSIKGTFGIDKGVNTFDITAEISGEYSEISPGVGNEIIIDDVKVVCSLEDLETISVKFTGDAAANSLHRSSILNSVELRDADIEAKIVYQDGEMNYLLDKTAGVLALVDHGIAFELTDINYSKETQVLYAETVKVSGYNNGTIISNVKSIDGSFKGVEISLLGEPTIKVASADVVCTQYDGVTLKYTVEVNGNIATDTYEVDEGTFYLDDLFQFKIMDMLMDYEGADSYLMKIIGDGKLVVYYFDDEEMDYEGTFYVKNGYDRDNLDLALQFKGALLGVSFPVGATGPVFTIAAQDGFKLDATSFDGFTVDDRGIVTIDPSIVEAGYGTLIAEGVGEMFKLTLDGTEYEAQYGELFTHEYRGMNPIFVVGSDGKSAGFIVNGKWNYPYAVLGDASFTTIYGEQIVPKADDVVVINDNTFTFDVPEVEFSTISVKAGNGVVMSYSAIDIAGTQKVSACFTEVDKINGNKTFQVDSDAPVLVSIPVETKDAKLFHMVGGEPVLMDAIIVEDDGKYTAMAYLDSFSLYYIEEGSSSGSSNVLLYAAVIVAIIVVIAVAVVFIKKKQTA